MASECWTVIAHFEVLLRHRIDQALQAHTRESRTGIPWFFQSSALPESAREPLQRQVARLESEGRLDRDQVVAGMTFGFWKSLFSSDDLWREALHQVFPNRSGLQRKDVTARLESIRKFRNRVAHHDSLLNVDIPHEVRSLLELTRSMDEDYAAWIEANSSWADLYSESPHQPADTVVVAARDAWPIYTALCAQSGEAPPAYICQPGRFFKPVERLGFYSDQMIHQEIPRVLARFDNIEWTLQNAGVLAASASRDERKIARLIQWSAGPGAVYFDFDEQDGPAGRFQVFLLSGPGHPHHKTLPAPVPHLSRGPGSAFTQRQRYVSAHALDTAQTTGSLTHA
ncbi:hypothetical protein [Micrococcus sp.]|uniref:hypothetical protein n=1 Tax=Micrococcus sp. TaxID=1271 RepID=UPI002A90A5E9|nr:hypothetical protein [Micrococcus sp.]MDY6056058.1 hypothetical protein [Micrococcus sp.]